MKSAIKTVVLAAATALLLPAFSGCGKPTTAECLEKGVEKAASGDWEAAAKWSERALDNSPDSVDALIFKAISAERTGNRDAALDAARRAAEAAPGSYAAQYTLGRLCAADPARRGEAIQRLWRAYKERPDDSAAVILLYNTATAAKLPQAANFFKLLDRYPDCVATSEWHNQAAIQALNRRDFTTARNEFLAACRGGTPHPAALYNTAIFFDRYGGRQGVRTARGLYTAYLKRAAESGESASDIAAARSRLAQLR